MSENREELTLTEVKKAKVLQTIVLPLIVPTESEVLNSANLDLSKSDLNACYSKSSNGQSGKKQSWYDVQLIVNFQGDLPSRKEWFYMVTDDGDLFKACFTGKRVKRLCTFENKKIIGVWIKERLVEWEALESFKFVHQDQKRSGIITKETLDFYGGDTIYIKKTNKTKKDEDGITRDIWLISFPYRLYSAEGEECLSDTEF
ncbi:hypothetical protein DNK47_02460 [Mycoplasma wenyonii]|uniref:Restriction endonuclease type II NgoFVII C-terminal B3-like DNA-binding domain-containing protein n=1 Tax=Mycoplasma wenyonii TaxID=65123 RepID=A0A328PTV0_9MOLU|nr:restriction endonuclease PLD domain-containing protein [Mycoplasma wenyonii]RAO94911.1 hypothetical protein DNK47_02460 [Mycoplasma wenyonii]